MNLVEGSNGPQLSCEAAGEPQVQYRWLLLKSGNNIITSSDLVAARYNMKHYGNLSSSQPMLSSESAGPAQGSPSLSHTNDDAHVGGAIADLVNEETSGSRLLELTGLTYGEQVGGTSVSTLDLSDRGLERKQSGHYICEATNRLGQKRHSVYLNILCK